VEHRVESADRAGLRDRFLHLAEDLVLADDERLQAPGDPHRVANALFVAELDDGVGLGSNDDVAERPPGGGGVLAGDVRLDAVAGDEDERPRDALATQQVRDGGPFVGRCRRLDLVDAGASVRDADGGYAS